MKTLRENEYLISIVDDGIIEKNPRYNGGWAKKITGLDKSQQNGYSIIGKWCDKGQEYVVKEGCLYIDCNNTGSRKHPTQNYTIFTIENGKVKILKRHSTGSYDKHWAVEVWPEIETFLNQEKEEISPLVQFSIEQLVTELQSRGHAVKLNDEIFPAIVKSEKSRFAALEMK